MARILIADSLAESVASALRSDGHDVTSDPSLTSSSLSSVIASYEILIVRSTAVTRDIISAGRNLALIVRAGAGVDTIDVDAASEYGVLVSNAPGCNSDAVAELAIGHLISCDRQIVSNSLSLRSGVWVKERYLNCRGLHGRTLGVIGAGAIAQRVIRAAQALGMRVLCLAPELDASLASRLRVSRASDRLELARESDAISVHIPLLRDTVHFCSAEFFAEMRPGAIFVNTSRGEIVDTAALANAIRTKELRVGLDVFEHEPEGGEGEFRETELAALLSSGTCHIGGSTAQASEAIAEEVIAVVRRFVETGQARNCVNIEGRPAADVHVAIQHKGVLAEVMAALAGCNAQVISLNNQLLTGGTSQAATIDLKVRKPVEASLKGIAGVLKVSVSST